ncbi:MAG: nucleotidyltransferase family protein [Lachnospiraceae bacterium]|nr:nucleotidyltransferase family protein [Lachnospiraceae bacterium]
MEQHENLLCHLLEYAINGKHFNGIGNYTADEYNKAIKTAAMHNVLPLLYDTLDNAGTSGDILTEKVENMALQAVQQSYHLLFLSKYVINILEENGIKAVLLKGSSTASLYPVPELRKSGDVDLLLENAGSVDKAGSILIKAGFRMETEQHAHHHVVYKSPDGIDVELHSLLVEPFDNNRINNYLEKAKAGIFKDNCRKDVMGIELPVLSEPFHAFYLLLHMLQHFLRSGFGLKLICDWAVFWNRDIPQNDKSQFLQFVKESGIYGFARMATLLCVYYLGLCKDNVSFMLYPGNNYNAANADEKRDREDAKEFMEEVFEAGEFGKTSPDRMVVLRGTGWISYIREFHHQMRLTYPKAGHIIIFWPVLWIMTFTGFLHRNRSIRNVTGSAIIKKAAQRSRLAGKMRLFKNT